MDAEKGNCELGFVIRFGFIVRVRIIREFGYVDRNGDLCSKQKFGYFSQEYVPFGTEYLGAKSDHF